MVDDREVVGSPEYVRLLFWVIGLAVPAALLTLIFLAVYEQGIHLYQSLAESLSVPPALITIMVGTLGGLLVGLGLRYLGVRHGKTMQEEMAEGKVSYRGLPGFMLVALVGLVSGASVGPEGPLAHMGAGMGSWLADRKRYPAERSRILSLSGISAAFGGFLGTPLAAAFMSVEFTGLLATPVYAYLIAATVAAMIGGWLLYALTGWPPAGAEAFPAEGALNLLSFPYALLFGFIGLAWAFLFKILFGGMRRLAGMLDRYPLLKPMVGGMIFGMVGAWQPLTLFSGEQELVEVLQTGAELGVATLILLAALKLFTLSVCLATGFPGGFVFPLFFSAGSLGYAIHLLLPFIPLPICIVGMMAGIGGAVMRMPFAVIFLLVILGGPALLPVSVLAAVTSYLAASILDAGSARKAMQQAGAGRREVYVEPRG